MLKTRQFHRQYQRGFSLLEVLITILILVFGLLGLAGLQSKVQLAEFESYQRTQAMQLLSDMEERMSANRSQALSYVSASTVGTGDSQPASCTNVSMGYSRDLCEWSNELKGAAEQKAASNVGVMVGARGCITQVQAASAGTCTPGIYRTTVVWQGMFKTSAPVNQCGQGSYGASDSYRRAIATQIVVGLPSC